VETWNIGRHKKPADLVRRTLRTLAKGDDIMWVVREGRPGGRPPVGTAVVDAAAVAMLRDHREELPWPEPLLPYQSSGGGRAYLWAADGRAGDRREVSRLGYHVGRARPA